MRLHLLLWRPLTMALVPALMRPFKAKLIALQYKHRRHDFGERARVVEAFSRNRPGDEQTGSARRS